MAVQTISSRWSLALNQIFGHSKFDNRIVRLAPPAPTVSRAREQTRSDVLSEHLQREFAKIREEEQNILDKLIMFD